MLLASIILLRGALALEQAGQVAAAAESGRVRVFLDCATGCFEDYLREEIEFVDHVRDRSDADVHVLVTTAETGAGGSEYTLAFIGQGRFSASRRTLTVTVDASDSEDRVRRALHTAVTVGLLDYVADGVVPESLAVTAEMAEVVPAADAATDSWNNWIFSLNGNFELDAEESQSEQEWRLSVGADRMTPEWKLSIGGTFNRAREEFELEDEGELSVERRDQSLNWLTVKSLGAHWSLGAKGQITSSTFDNIEIDVRATPAVEWNFFPLHATAAARVVRRWRRARAVLRGNALRQARGDACAAGTVGHLRATRAVGHPAGARRVGELLPRSRPPSSQHRGGGQPPPRSRVLGGPGRVGDADPRSVVASATGGDPEEVLLRLRQLQSGFETRVEFGIQFGSAFAQIVNPRFGQ